MAQDGGGQGDTGLATLSGSIQAGLQQVGASVNGEMTLGPTSGNDQVNLSGSFSNTTEKRKGGVSVSSVGGTNVHATIAGGA